MYYIEIFFLKYEFIAASSTPTTNVIIFCRLLNIYYNNNNNIAFLIFFGGVSMCVPILTQIRYLEKKIYVLPQKLSISQRII